ncbi:hypothetical protein ACFSQT_34595 [Mesorhizobium calcicola]|uniref:Uncharacterized protein n=1 Tax=Mesorhizobium calcicola TaxID=1300310 RepID=A0ABW4WQ06_9HYPH
MAPPDEVVIDSYDAAAKTISGHFSVSGKDDDGKPVSSRTAHFQAFRSVRGKKMGRPIRFQAHKTV